LSSAALSVAVFLAGAGTLALELLASRLLAPAFGSSLHVWGAILSVTLVCLALGYRLGGAQADRIADPSARLVLVVVAAAGWIGLVPSVAAWPVGWLADLGSLRGPALAIGLLFGVPLVLLSMVTPLAFGARSRAQGAAGGGLLGDLFALSTLGSVCGALATAYAAVPGLGVRRTFLLVALVLFASVLPGWWRGGPWRAAQLALVLVCLGEASARFRPTGPALAAGKRFVHREASIYGALDVVEDEVRGERVLLLDGASQNRVEGAVWETSVFDYVGLLLRRLDPPPRPAARALVLGLGAGSVVRGLDRIDYDVESVEIDGAVVRVAREHFAFPHRLTVHVTDGRLFLEQAKQRAQAWDVVVLDVAGGGTHPVHLYTLEALTLVREVLKPGGQLAVNVVVDLRPGRDAMARHVVHTVSAVWPAVQAWEAAPSQRDSGVSNLVIFAGERLPRLSRPRFAPEWPYRPLEPAQTLTDDWAPVEPWSVDTNRAWHRQVRSWLGAGILVPF
jgi:spermidine synthase